MTQTTVHEKIARNLQHGVTEVKFCSPDGIVLGRFRSEALRKLYAESKCPVNTEELERRHREEGGRTLDDIVADQEAARWQMPHGLMVRRGKPESGDCPQALRFLFDRFFRSSFQTILA